MTRTHQAKTRFLEVVTSIRGVALVGTYGGDTLTESFLLVYVPSLFSEAAREVFELQGRIHRDLPGVRLDVEVNGIEDLGIDARSLHDSLPADVRIHFPKSYVTAYDLAAAG